MTKLLYLNDMCMLNCSAHIKEVRRDQESAAIILDQTVFYPQGGGQPADRGVIKNAQATFVVEGVAKDADIVLHKGVFTDGQMFKGQDEVELQVDPEIRAMSLPGYEPILCKGTHVKLTSDIGYVTIRKIKNEKGNLRVSYAMQ